jgi:hypothetical protein
MKHLVAFIAMLLSPAVACAQFGPNFQLRQVPTTAEWQGYFAGKTDVNNGTMNNGAINGGSMSGTIGGSPTFTGNPHFSGSPSFDAPVSGSGAFSVPVDSSTAVGRTIAAHFQDVINVKDAPYNAKGDGVTNDTTAFQAAAAAVGSGGATIEIPVGNYLISDTATLSSNTRIHCARGAVITAASAAQWPGGISQGIAFRATSGTNFEIAGCRFSYAQPGAGHILSFEGVSNISVHDNISNGADNFTAFIGTMTSFEYGNIVTGVRNSCFDHWGGFRDVHVTGNYCATGTVQNGALGAIEFTGINSDQSAATSAGFEAVGNTIYGHNLNQCIVVNGHASGGTDDRGKIIGNTCVFDSSTTAWGVLVTGHANFIEIADNIFYNNGSPTFSAVSAASPATNINIHDNTAYGWQAGASGVFANTATGGGGLYNNKAFSSSSPLLGSVDSAVVSYGNDTGTGTLNLGNVNITSGSAAFTANVSVGSGGSFSTINSPTFGWNGAGGIVGLINGAAGHSNGWRWQTAAVNHWYLGTDATTQSGSNAGDNFELIGQSDAGANLWTNSFVRASGHYVIGGGGTTTVASGSSDCGTSPSLAGNDNVGRVTVGSSANGGKCTVTFANSWTNAPVCSVADETTANSVRPVATTTTLAITGTLTAADKIVYRCVGY